MSALAPVLTPHGRLLLAGAEDAPELAGELTRRLRKAFARGAGHGLLQLGAGEMRTALPPVLGYWREFSARYVTALCALPEVDGGAVPPISAAGRRGPRIARRGGAADDRRRVSDGPVLDALWTDAGRGVSRRSSPQSKLSVQDVPRAQEPGVEPGGPRPLQPRREPEG